MKEASRPGKRNSASALQVTSAQKPAKGRSLVATLLLQRGQQRPPDLQLPARSSSGRRGQRRAGAGSRRAGGGTRRGGADVCAIKLAARTGTDLLRAAAPLSFLFRARPAPCTSRVPPWLRSPGTRSSRSCWSGTGRTLPTSSCANFLSQIRSASTTSGARTEPGLPGTPSRPAGPRLGPHFVLDASLEWVLGTRVLARGPRLLSH